jgi:hypothetical protein
MATETVVSLSSMIRQLTRAGLIRPGGSDNLPPLKAYLRAWQSTRLAQTYADLLAGNEYGPACRFFLSDLYSPQDFSRRDAEIRRAIGFLRRALPEMMIRGLLKAIDLQDLSSTLDDALLEVMTKDMGLIDSFTRSHYEKAYRMCANYDERMRQIGLIIEAGRILQSAHRIPFTGSALLLARLPVRMIGWGELHDFLQRGYDASAPVQDYEFFLHTVESRERAILNRIYGMTLSEIRGRPTR